MTNEPVISVVIPCYNEERNIHDCLESVTGQDLSAPFEVLVVDGGSTDNTLSIVREFSAEPVPVRVIPNPRRHVAFARNLGWRASSGSYVAYTDADCIVPRGWLSRLLKAFEVERDPALNIVAVGGGNRPSESGDFYRLLRLLFSSPFGSRKTVQTELFAEQRLVPHLPTLNVMILRKALADAEGFDEVRFPSVGEDEDLSTRLGLRGGKLLYIPDCVVVHRQKDNLRAWAWNMELYGYGRFALMKRHPHLRRLRDLRVLALPLAVLLAVFTPLFPFAWVFLALYLFTITAHSLWLTARSRETRRWGRLLSLFLITHGAYAAGWLRGASSALATALKDRA
jgi:glycosyltransferase involved in cell wall biosynthesis